MRETDQRIEQAVVATHASTSADNDVHTPSLYMYGEGGFVDKADSTGQTLEHFRRSGI